MTARKRRGSPSLARLARRLNERDEAFRSILESLLKALVTNTETLAELQKTVRARPPVWADPDSDPAPKSQEKPH